MIKEEIIKNIVMPLSTGFMGGSLLNILFMVYFDNPKGILIQSIIGVVAFMTYMASIIYLLFYNIKQLSILQAKIKEIEKKLVETI